ncbi:MAG: hypothetical protein UR42_C0011G0011 [Candidatus Roizmanbacteria bacterium GW2011_GWA2_33_33]|uniref:Transposase IS200-like domain-containing protein n=2 Tax=Candidatus Roizmaniibacteriota TaxID=1752723 RepID=A0A0G0BEL5_9BACT|nr:MAG: hypothetical protein UR42_C0011G0011 [Candidatus Roizmanbacteria bacterium GW2011_GWA2_33_33]KKP62041.1 MAG: hypothetical protein UR56_C0007G0024 [Candidatus Roizmanbacteria bacterium GW2011_GWC2_34_23]
MNVIKHRKQNRLNGFNYSSNGYYFVTICTKDREKYFGNIIDNKMVLNNIGEIVNTCWLEIPNHFPNVELDEFQIMPNHVHMIIIINNKSNTKNKSPVGNKYFCSLQNINISWQTKLSGSLSSVIRGFKIGVTKKCRTNNNKIIIWQKSFYDQIIRTEYSLYFIRQYIHDNPLNWESDRNNFNNKNKV